MLTELRHSLVSKSWLPDLALIALAWWMAFWLRFNLGLPARYVYDALITTPIALVGMACGLIVLRVPRQSWRYVSLADLRGLAAGVGLGALLTMAVVLGLRIQGFPRSVFLISAVLALVFLAGARATWRTLMELVHAPTAGTSAAQPLLVVGTLEEADQALRTLKGVTGWQVRGVVSPNVQDTGRTLQGIPVLGSVEQLAKVAQAGHISTILLASPPGAALRREVLLRWSASGLVLLTLPSADEWLSPGAVAPREVRLEDLLGRAPVQLDAQGLSALVGGQTVLVTGAAGSIGSELCRQVARFGATRLVCVDQSEFSIYQLEQELRRSFPNLRGVFLTVNVRESERIADIARQYQPTMVLHAAAYKHVPLMEESNEVEALRTNVLGTLYAAKAAALCGAQRFVLVSTDKAVNPTSVMGASKRLAELGVQAVADEFPRTQFLSVRFGNVLGSSGSVVPLFTSQIEKGGPITVTHPEIVRYFMTIPEAAQLVLQAGLMGSSGQIFVLDMGEPVKIAELARMLIRLSGKSETQVPIVYTGLRPGEKLYEELLADDETTELTPHPKLRVAKAGGSEIASPSAIESAILDLGVSPSGDSVRGLLHRFVPEYQVGKPKGEGVLQAQ
ncbi:polysaccharide biosynthesis protein [Ottowia thiooxydans]|uniref:FlaA1/EpsC-like NDP-sugar epimerase n=1 Tax=Ottowia thiooxydans TaxID=219182 RepID=A0ABV2Q3P7_9BURK